MTATQTPAWIAAISLAVAALLLLVGALCWSAPQLLFGGEGYRTVTRGIIGALGALTMGLGVSLLQGLRQGGAALLGPLRAALVSFALLPAVIFFNFGALEPLRASTGIDLIMIALIVLAGFVGPLALATATLGGERQEQGSKRPLAGAERSRR